MVWSSAAWPGARSHMLGTPMRVTGRATSLWSWPFLPIDARLNRRKITVKVVFTCTCAARLDGDRLSSLQEWPRRRDGPSRARCGVAALSRCGECPRVCAPPAAAAATAQGERLARRCGEFPCGHVASAFCWSASSSSPWSWPGARRAPRLGTVEKVVTTRPMTVVRFLDALASGCERCDGR